MKLVHFIHRMSAQYDITVARWTPCTLSCHYCQYCRAFHCVYYTLYKVIFNESSHHQRHHMLARRSIGNLSANVAKIDVELPANCRLKPKSDDRKPLVINRCHYRLIASSQFEWIECYHHQNLWKGDLMRWFGVIWSHIRGVSIIAVCVCTQKTQMSSTACFNAATTMCLVFC